MPIKKTVTNSTKAQAVKSRAVKTSSKEDDLMDFDQFVARTPKKEGGNKAWLFATLIVVILGLLGALFFLSRGNFDKEMGYKAIFLDNNQVYFAKVVKEDSLNIYLSDVYYIQTQQQVVPATEEDQEDQVVEVPILIKRGGELHQPSGWMQINREKIVSIEEIGDDSEVLKEIQRQESLPAASQ